MEKIYISDAGPKVSPAIYGFYRWQNDTDTNMDRIINLCLDLGINTFDHADTYGGYQCEKLFGNVISQKGVKRDSIVLFSKCGVRIPHQSQPQIRVAHYDTSAKHILMSVENSLKNLRTDYIDIFLLNHLDAISNLEETAIALEQLKKSGKVRNIGATNLSVFQHQLLASFLHTPIVTHHIELNLLNTSALDNGQLDYIKQRYMRPIASAPAANGRLVDGTDAQSIRVRKKLQELAPKYGVDIESVGVAWLIKLGALPLIGTQDEQRIRNVASAFNINLDNQDWYELYSASRGEIVIS
jgi:predicted oxidoreductase